MLPDFNRLRIFYHIYKHNSIVTASRNLHLTQPAVSQQLKKLEMELDAPLFIRLHKKLVPTAAGKKLYALVQPFVEQLSRELEEISHPLDRPAGLLRIGSPREFGKEYLPPLFHSYRQQAPDVRLALTLDETAPLLEMLKQGELDFILADVFMPKGQQLDTPQLFSIEPLIAEELILACSRSYHRQRIGDDESFAHLARQDYLCDENDQLILTHWFKHHYGKSISKLKIVMTANSHEAILAGMRQGMGLGVTSTHLVYEQLYSGELVPLGMKTNAKCWISLVQFQDKVPTLAEKTFIEHLKRGMQNAQMIERFSSRLPQS